MRPRAALQVGEPWYSLSMTAGFKVVLSTILLLLLTAPSVPAEFTYKEYAKEPEPWKRGYVFGISRYVSAVAQPDEEPPYPVRDAFQRCLASVTDGVLVRQVESYIAANPASSKGPMVTVVVRALFDFAQVGSMKTAGTTTSSCSCRRRARSPLRCSRLPTVLSG
jgi:hypothetical protein